MSAPLPTGFEADLRAICAPLLAPLPPRLRAAIEYSLFSGGKRIRPRIALETSSLVGLDPDLAKSAAAAVEMVHTYTLIHDDLPCMDDDDFRRGVPTNHKVHGEATALLAGDALIGLAQETLLTCRGRVPNGALLDALALLARLGGGSGVIAGQCLEADLAQNADRETLSRVHALKTGALFEASLLLPPVLAGWPGERLPPFQALARAWGAAFQIADDLEDPEEDAVRDPRNIRAYLERDPAAALARAGMDEAIAALERELGREAPGLRDIGAEILRKLGAPA